MDEILKILKDWLPLLNTLGIIAILLHYIKKLRGIHQETTKLQDEHIAFLKSQTPAFMFEQLQAIKSSAEEKINNLENEKAEIEKKLIDAEIRFQEELKKGKLSPENLSNIYKAKEEIETSSRSEFAARIAHEILLPIQSMAIKIEHLSSKLEGSDRAIVNDLQRELKRTVLSIQSAQLSSFQVQDKAFGLRRFKVNKLIMDTYNIVADLANNNKSPIKLNIENDIKELIINSDYEKLQIILYNILSNAIKYSYSGKDIILNVFYKNSELIFEVVNIGIGIDSTEKDLIFSKGYRGALSSERQRTGAGMGLYLASNLTRSFDGNIKFESKIIENSAFQVIVIVKIPIK